MEPGNAASSAWSAAVRVRSGEITARYRDGVPRVELTELEPGKPGRVPVEAV
jgi:HSP20 family molecular chaperone IbpA